MSELMIRINRKAVFWIIITVGFALPWLTGIGVKLYLDALGRPTIEWHDAISFDSLIFIIPATIWWGAGYIILAFLARGLLSSSSLSLKLRLPTVIIFCAIGLLSIVLGRLYEGFALLLFSILVYRVMQFPSLGLDSYLGRMLLILCGFLGAVIGSIHTFMHAWTNVENVFYGFFIFPFICLPYMATGLFVGYLAGKYFDTPHMKEPRS